MRIGAHEGDEGQRRDIFFGRGRRRMWLCGNLRVQKIYIRYFFDTIWQRAARSEKRVASTCTLGLVSLWWLI